MGRSRGLAPEAGRQRFACRLTGRLSFSPHYHISCPLSAIKNRLNRSHRNYMAFSLFVPSVESRSMSHTHMRARPHLIPRLN